MAEVKEITTVITLKITAKTSGELQGKILRIAREAKELSQRELGEMIGVSRSAIARWESQGIGEEIYLLEKVLGLEPGALNPKH